MSLFNNSGTVHCSGCQEGFCGLFVENSVVLMMINDILDHRGIEGY